MLQHAPWPGNVRQVRSAVEYLLTRARRENVDELTPAHWPPLLPRPAEQVREVQECEVPLTRADEKAKLQALARSGTKVKDLLPLTTKKRSTVYNWTKGHRPDRNSKTAGRETVSDQSEK